MSTRPLDAFFLPHIAYSGNPFQVGLAHGGPALLTLGLGTFFVCAGQVYGAKLFRMGVVSGGLYRRVRHPQYLGLSIAGLDEHKAHHGEGEQGGVLAVLKHLGEMYALKPMRQLRDGATATAQRVIFTEALAPTGRSVRREEVLDIPVQRYPLFLADFDAQARLVTLTMETPRRHTWGTIPVPAF